jgi:uncharacterized protein
MAPFIGAESGAIAFSSWENAFAQLIRLSEKKRMTIVIDEFPYLTEAAPSITSLLQNLWDRKFSKTKIMLIVCGSHYNMMKREFLSDRGPLFGRTTANILVDEIEPTQLHYFLPQYSLEQIIETFSIIGGVPKYLEMWDDGKPVLKNIEDLILSSVSIFRQEPMFLIQDEIPEVRTYMGILDAIGTGQTHQKSIGEKCGIPLSHVGKYMSTLLNLGFVRRTVSVDALDREKSRMTRYEIKDRFLRFYFTFVRPNLPLLEQQRTSHVLKGIELTFAGYVARNGFEEICRREIAIRGDGGSLPFQPQYVGRIWNRHAEIDVAAIDDKSRSVLLGECKWTERPIGEELLNELINKAALLPSISSFKKHFALFSKSGFTSSLIRKAAKEGCFLFSKKDFALLNHAS